MPTSPTRGESLRAHWAAIPPEQRREATRKARLAHAVHELVDQAPKLTDDQRARIRAILRPADETLVFPEDDDAPGTRVPGRRDHPGAAKQAKGRGHHATGG